MIPRLLSKSVDQLIIGGNINALEFAYHNGIPVFYDKLEIPFERDLTAEGVSKKNILLTYANLLSLAGLNYSSYNIDKFSIDNNTLRGFGKLPWTLEIKFKKLHDMRSTNVKTNLFRVVDYVDVRSAGNHQVKLIKTKEKFVNEIIFYPSQRMNASKNYSPKTHDYEKIAKDIMIVSYLTQEQIEDDEYSAMYSRIIAKELMKQHGIKGRIRKQYENGKVLRHSISLSFNRREIFSLEEKSRNYYYNNTKHNYLERITKYLYGKTWRKNNNQLI